MPGADVSLSVLARIQIASVCTAAWDDMTPTDDARIRHCAQCNLKVHDLSSFTRDEAEGLVSAHLGPDSQGGRLCAKWRRRADGTIIFGDCPVGWEKVRACTRRSAARLAALVGITSILAALLARAERAGWEAREYRAFVGLARWIGVDPVRIEVPAEREEMMGDVQLAPDPPDR